MDQDKKDLKIVIGIKNVSEDNLKKIMSNVDKCDKKDKSDKDKKIYKYDFYGC